MKAKISEAPVGSKCNVMITSRGSPWYECRSDDCVSRYEAEDGVDLFVCVRHLAQMGFEPLANLDHTNPVRPRVVDTDKPELPVSKRRMAALEKSA